MKKKPKLKKCKICPTKFQSFNSLQKVCSVPCAAELARSSREKKEAREHQDKKRKFKLNDVKHQKELTKTVFNRLRVLQEKKWFADRGLEPECISCGKTNMDWACGHFKPAGSQGIIRYDPMNTYLQCNRYCNMGLSGNIEGNKNTRGYKQGLRERFGEEEGNQIIEYCETNTEVKKWSGIELKDMRKEFSKQIRGIENELS